MVAAGRKTMRAIRIGLIGDYDPQVKAHRAIPMALALASETVGQEVAYAWLPTESLGEDVRAKLSGFDALWCVPASPYRSMSGALNGIRYARESGTPFLGTCGGFQHALIEYARDVLGISDAGHAETNPDASVLFISPLACPLVEGQGVILPEPNTKLAAIYEKREVLEQYNCSFGLNPEYRGLLEDGDMTVSALDTEGEVRAIELRSHPFFMATLYQPERSALAGARHPLIEAFVQAAVSTHC